jgi:hypothetical protein
MKRFLLLARIILLVAALAVAFASCERTDAISDADLVGTWEIEDASARIYVAGVDLTDVLKLTYSYADAEAAAMADSLESMFVEDMQGALLFDEAHDFSIMLVNEPEETGTWTLSSDGTTLSLEHDDTAFDQLTIEGYEEPVLTITLPTAKEVMDMKEDGAEDVSVDVVIKIVLMRVAV